MIESERAPARAFERRPVFSWCLFDWANSPFPAIVLTFVIPAYFAMAVVGDAATATSQWAFMIGTAALVIAFASPILGSIADQGRRRKPWLALFTAIFGRRLGPVVVRTARHRRCRFVIVAGWGLGCRL